MKIKNLKIDGYENFDFPLDKKDICHILDKLPSEDFDGLKDIIITNPIKNEDFKRYGRYDPDFKRIYLFSHQKDKRNFIIECGYKEQLKKFITLKLTFEDFKEKAQKALIHEIGHHVGIKKFNDDSEDFANNYQNEKMLIFL